MKTSRGFSLIELMIVVAIISILCMMALPTYQQYTQRARFSEVMAIAASYKLAVTLALQEGVPPADIHNDAPFLPPPIKNNRHLASLEIDHGIITARSTEIAGDSTVVLTPSEDGSSWQLSGSCLERGLCRA